MRKHVTKKNRRHGKHHKKSKRMTKRRSKHHKKSKRKTKKRIINKRFNKTKRILKKFLRKRSRKGGRNNTRLRIQRLPTSRTTFKPGCDVNDVDNVDIFKGMLRQEGINVNAANVESIFPYSHNNPLRFPIHEDEEFRSPQTSENRKKEIAIDFIKLSLAGKPLGKCDEDAFIFKIFEFLHPGYIEPHDLPETTGTLRTRSTPLPGGIMSPSTTLSPSTLSQSEIDEIANAPTAPSSPAGSPTSSPALSPASSPVSPPRIRRSTGISSLRSASSPSSSSSRNRGVARRLF